MLNCLPDSYRVLPQRLLFTKYLREEDVSRARGIFIVSFKMGRVLMELIFPFKVSSMYKESLTSWMVVLLSSLQTLACNLAMSLASRKEVRLFTFSSPLVEEDV